MSLSLEVLADDEGLVLTEQVTNVIITEQSGDTITVIQPAAPTIVQVSGGPLGPQGLPGADGSDGLSAYQIAVDNGFVGTEPEWLSSLQGADGQQGIQGLKGDTGDQGPAGVDGDSAYQVAVTNGFVGTQSEWLASLEGPQGIQGVKGDTGNTGTAGATGASGLSAYQVAVNNGFVGTESEWISSLEGPQGIQGEQGPAGIAEDFSLYGVMVTKYWTGTWPARTVPAGYTGAVVWDSSTDAAATQPTNAVEGDRWLRNVP